MRYDKIKNAEMIGVVMNTYGTAMPAEIMRFVKEQYGIDLDHSTVYNHVQEIKKNNEHWLNGQARGAWLHTLRQIYRDKQDRITALTKTFNELDTSKARNKAYVADIINQTESSLIEGMETLPLYRKLQDYIEGNEKVKSSV